MQLHIYRFRRQSSHLLRFWTMDPSLPGVMKSVAVTVLQFQIGSRLCSSFNPLVHLKTVAEAVRLCKRNPGLFSPVVLAEWQGRSCQMLDRNHLVLEVLLRMVGGKKG